MSNILVVAEHLEGKLRKATLPTIGFAKKAQALTGGKIIGLVLGHNAASVAAELATAGVDHVIHVDSPIYANYLASPSCLNRWLSGRRSAESDFDLAEPVSVFSSFARQYGAAWAVLRILSGRFSLEALPRLEEACVPVTIWWPGAAGSEPPASSQGRPGVRVDLLDQCGALAPLDRPGDLTARLRVELFQPVRLAEA